MIPKLYEQSETAFTGLGLGGLTDLISCTVTEERNGIYVLEAEYPNDGRHADEILPNRIIYALAHDGDEKPQPFRIVTVDRKSTGTMTIEAEHVRCQLSKITMFPYLDGRYSDDPAIWWGWMLAKKMMDCPFSFSCDFRSPTVHKLQPLTKPNNMLSCLLGEEGSILDSFGGEYLWDGYKISLLSNRGTDNGVRIAYGKNIMALEQETSTENIITTVLAYYLNSDGTFASGNQLQSCDDLASYPYPFTYLLDMTSEYNSPPTARQLNADARAYITSNYKGLPASIKVDFQPLWQTEEYKEFAPLEHVNLCDTVTVEYGPLGITGKIKVVKTEFDVLREKYNSVELGTIKQTLADTIAGLFKSH